MSGSPSSCSSTTSITRRSFLCSKRRTRTLALPAKVANQVLLQLHHAWTAFFEAMDAYREYPDKFTGRPRLPNYLHKTQGRNLLVFELGCIWKAELRGREIAVSHLGYLGETRQQPASVRQVRLVPKADHYVLEVVYEAQEQRAEGLDPALFVALDRASQCTRSPDLE